MRAPTSYTYPFFYGSMEDVGRMNRTMKLMEEELKKIKTRTCNKITISSKPDGQVNYYFKEKLLQTEYNKDHSKHGEVYYWNENAHIWNEKAHICTCFNSDHDEYGTNCLFFEGEHICTIYDDNHHNYCKKGQMVYFYGNEKTRKFTQGRRSGELCYIVNDEHIRTEFADDSLRHGEVIHFRNKERVKVEFIKPHPKEGLSVYYINEEFLKFKDELGVELLRFKDQMELKHNPSSHIGEVFHIVKGELVCISFNLHHPRHGEETFFENDTQVRTKFDNLHPKSGEIVHWKNKFIESIEYVNPHSRAGERDWFRNGICYKKTIDANDEGYNTRVEQAELIAQKLLEEEENGKTKVSNMSKKQRKKQSRKAKKATYIQSVAPEVACDTTAENNETTNTEMEDFEFMSIQSPTLNTIHDINSLDTDTVESKKSSLNDDSESEDFECVICLEERKSHVIVPCGHRCVCAKCADIIKDQCPMCKQSIMMIIPCYT